MFTRKYWAAAICAAAVVSVGAGTALPTSSPAMSTVRGGTSAPGRAAQEWKDDTKRGPVPIPRTIKTPAGTAAGAPYNFWTSARLANERSRRGSMRDFEEAFEIHDVRGKFAAARANPPANCVELGSWVYNSQDRLPETLEEAVTMARVVYSGTVIGIDGGFVGGESPGLLLQIEVSEWIKQRPDYPQAPIVYVYYPAGDFQYGDLRVCVRNEEWPEPPEVGAEVLLYPAIRSLSPDGSIQSLHGDGWGIAFEENGNLRVGRSLAERIPEFGVADFEEWKGAMRDEVRRQQGAAR